MLFPLSPQLFSIKHAFSSQLAFFTDRYSYVAGEEVQVFISQAPSQKVIVQLEDLYREGTFFSQEIVAYPQSLQDSAAINGVNWEALTFRIPDSLAPGWYLLSVSNGEEEKRSSLFIQPQEKQVKKRIAWFLSTNTWNAYNPWGGFSLYSKAYTHTVSFRRPQPLSDPYLPATLEHHQLYFHAATKDLYLARLLDSAGREYDVYDMMALDQHDPRLEEYEVFIFSTHCEYWTEPMLQHLNQLLGKGKSVMMLAGNVAAYRSYLSPESQQLTVYKSPEELWPVVDTAGLRPFGTEVYLMGYHTYAPYEVVADTSWLLAGTDLQKGSLFGKESDAYDYTYMYGSPLDQLKGLLNRDRMGAASGLEIDKAYSHTPDNWIRVARGLNPNLQGQGQVWPTDEIEWDGKGGADMGYYLHPGGGMVFSSSSMSFTGAIPYDPAIRQIILNFLKKCAKDQ